MHGTWFLEVAQNKLFFDEFIFLQDHINMLWEKLYLGKCTMDTMNKESTLYTPLIQNLWSMDNVSVCRSQCFPYILIYSLIQIFNAVFPIVRKL